MDTINLDTGYRDTTNQPRYTIQGFNQPRYRIQGYNQPRYRDRISLDTGYRDTINLIQSNLHVKLNLQKLRCKKSVPVILLKFDLILTSRFKCYGLDMKILHY